MTGFRYQLGRALGLLACVLCLSVASASPLPWPNEGSDLLPDPMLRLERLDNQMRVALRPGTAPAGRVSIRLLVLAGSLHERADARGAAHFVEHMAFAGTRHHPKGELVRYFERQGMGWGNETNAVTMADRTVYRMDLRMNDAASLREALVILRDFCDGILFEPAAVREERGVILAEARVRNTVDARRSAGLLNGFYPGSVLAEHPPIGIPTDLARLESQDLAEFHRSWYRPERVALVVAGDFDAEALLSNIREVFRDFQAQGAELDAPAPRIDDQNLLPSFTVTTDPEQTGISLVLRSLHQRPARALKMADHRQRMLAALCNFIIERRLIGMRVGKTPSFGASSCDLQGVDAAAINFAELGIGTSDELWRQALGDLVGMLRGLVRNGVSKAELERAKEAFSSSIEERLRAQEGQQARRGADEIVDCLATRRPLSDPDQDLRIWNQMKAGIGSADCQRLLAQLWETGHPCVHLIASPRKAPSEEELSRAYAQALQAPLQAPPNEEMQVFPYPSFGEPGKIARRQEVPALGATDLVFENECRVLLRPGTLTPGKVTLLVTLGTGVRGEPAELAGARAYTPLWLYGGLGRLPFGEIARLLTQHLGEWSVSASDEYFVYKMTCASRDLDFHTRLACAYVSDPAFNLEGMSMVKQNIDRVLQESWADFSGLINEYVRPMLAGGDLRFGQAHREDIARLALVDVRAWLAPQVTGHPVTLTIAGDFDPAKVQKLLAETFGALPARTDPSELNPPRPLKAPGKPIDCGLTWKGRMSSSRLLLCYWPLRHAPDSRQEVHLRVLTEVLKDRLREQLRDRLGKTYLQSAWLDLRPAYPDCGFIGCQAEIGENDEASLLSATRTLVAELAKGRISQDELERARRVLVTVEEQSRLSNVRWAESLALYARHPKTLERLQRFREWIMTLELRELNALAKEQFSGDIPIKFHISPAE